MKKTIQFICAILANSFIGAGLALILNVNPIYGIAAINLVAFVSGLVGGFLPKGVACEGLYAEVWTGALIKKFRTDPASLGWYAKIKSYNQYAQNDVLHFVDVQGDPTVLVNNTTYPLGIESIQDADKAISLDKLQTKPTRVTDDEMFALSYDKKASVIERHKDAIDEVKYTRAIHALAPDTNTDTTPIVQTSGEEIEGRKAITRKDIAALKRKFDKNKVPQIGRILVLCSDHVNDLLDTDQKFANQYYNSETGKVYNLYGFEIYDYVACPYFTTDLKKVPWGSVPAATDMQASIAFSINRAMKAEGTIAAYSSLAKDNPETQENLVAFKIRTICLPLKKDALGAIVSTQVTPPAV